MKRLVFFMLIKKLYLSFGYYPFCMKSLLLLIACLFAAALTWGQNFVLTDPITVASGYGNYHPQIEVMGDGQLGMIWTDASTNNLYFCKRTSMDVFSAPVKLNPDGTEVQDYNWSGPDLCASGSDVYVAYHNLGFEDGHIYLVKSEDYGVTFGDTVRIDNPAPTDYAQFPDVAVYNDTLYVVYMIHGMVTLNPQMMLTRSVDGGQTFEPVVDASGWLGDEACDCCQPELIVDDERVIIYFRRNASNVREIKALVSYDRGASFAEMYSPDDHNWNISACPSSGPDARFLNNENPVCIYRTSVAGAAKLFLHEFDMTTDNTVNLVDVYTDGITNSGINYPQLYVDGPLVGVVWEGLGSGTDVYFNASSTGVADLLPANAINVTDSTGSQSKPDIAILNGSFHIIYSELSGAKVNYVRVTSVNSVTENDAEDVIVAYPNPTKDIVVLNLNSGDFEFGLVDVFDLTGRKIWSQQIQPESDKMAVDLSSFVSGMYLLQLHLDDEIQNVSIVKN